MHQDHRQRMHAADAGGHMKWIEAARAEAQRYFARTTVSPGSAAPTFRDAARLSLRSELAARYEIGPEIRRGGQGVVFQGVQRGTRRAVAIKVMHVGELDDPSGRIRFEREARILATLRHPNIVTIHESGVAGGHAYYVMDFVPGAGLDEYLRANPQPAEGVLRLFEKICDAVNAAHLRGILHRDLKPSNIRVDPAGEPHVLDFGLAKLTTDVIDSSEAVQTETGQFVGSLAWASPEQISARTEDLDIRTDVYSIGVMLFTSLTLVHPYPVKMTIREAVDSICNSEPPRPSSLMSGIDSDIDQIVLKCLRKAPSERYQSAGDLARDLRRRLDGEPIEARRDSIAYVLRKQLLRYRYTAIGAMAFLVVLAAGLAASLTFWHQAAVARDAEKIQAQIARENGDRALSVQRFLESILNGVNPDLARGRDTTLLAALVDDAAARVSRDLPDQPEVRASIHSLIGALYKKLARYDDARGQLSKAKDLVEHAEKPDPVAIADACCELGDVERLAGHLDTAEQLARRSLDLYAQADIETPVRASSTELLANIRETLGFGAEAEGLYRAAVALRERVQGPGDEDVGNALGSLGSCLGDLGKYDEAETTLRRAVEIMRNSVGPEHSRYAEALHLLGIALGQEMKVGEARKCFEEAIAVQRRVLGPDHPDVAHTLHSLGTAECGAGHYAQAEAAYRESLDMLRKALGDQHASIAASLADLGVALQRQGKLDEARQTLEEGLSTARQALGDENPLVARCLKNLGDLLLDLKQLPEAEAYLREAVRIRRALLGPDHVDLAESLNALAIVHRREGRLDDAVGELEEAIRILRVAFHDPDQRIVASLANLGQARIDQDKPAAAEPLFREAAEISERVSGSESQLSQALRLNLGVALLGQAKAQEAAPLVMDAIERATAAKDETALQRLLLLHQPAQARLGADDPLTRTLAAALAALYTEFGDTENAARFMRKSDAPEPNQIDPGD